MVTAVKISRFWRAEWVAVRENVTLLHCCHTGTVHVDFNFLRKLSGAKNMFTPVRGVSKPIVWPVDPCYVLDSNGYYCVIGSAARQRFFSHNSPADKGGFLPMQAIDRNWICTKYFVSITALTGVYLKRVQSILKIPGWWEQSIDYLDNGF